MAAGMQITIDAAPVQAMLDRAPAQVTLRLRQLVEGAAISVQRELRLAAPVAVTGQLRNSIRYTFTPLGLTAEVKPEVPYATSVEYGSKAHFPPYKEGTPLFAWAQLKGMNPFLLARSISIKGTQPHPFVRPTYDKMKPLVEEEIAVGIGLLVRELNNGL